MSDELLTYFDLLDYGKINQVSDYINQQDKISLDFTLLKLYYLLHLGDLDNISTILIDEVNSNINYILIWKFYLHVERKEIDKATEIYNKLQNNTIPSISNMEHLRRLFYYSQACYFHLLQDFNKSEELFIALKLKINKNKYYYINGILFYKIAMIKINNQNLKESISSFLKGLDYFGLLNDKYNLRRSRNNLGIAFMRLGDNDNAIIHFHEAQKLSLQLNDDTSYNMATYNLGICMQNIGEYDKSENYFDMVKKYYVKSNQHSKLAYTIMNLGIINNIRGNIEQAIFHFTKAKNIFADITDSIGLSYCFQSLGISNQRIGKLQEAYDNYLRSEELRRSVSYKFEIEKLLFNLYSVSNELVNDQIEKYFNLLQEYPENSFAILSKAKELLKSKRIRNKVEAQDILHTLVESRETNPEARVLALLELVSILIEEYRDTKDQEIIKETTNLVKNLEKTAELQKSYWLQAQTLLLSSKLALLQLDVDPAKKLLNEAENLAEKHGFVVLAKSISNDYDKILKEMEIINTTIDKQSDMIAELGVKGFSELIGKMMSKRVDTTSYGHEEPILMLIMSEGGTTVYSNKFSGLVATNEQLIGGFMNSISTLLNEILSETGFVERIKIKDFTLLFKTVEKIAFLYIVKGSTFYARQNLEILIARILKQENDWKSFKGSIKKGRIDGDFNSLVDKMIDDIIIKPLSEK